MKYIAYPFLNETNDNLVDHEVFTDYLASSLGALVRKDNPLSKETRILCEKVLHVNGSLRGKCAIFDEDLKELENMYERLELLNQDRLRMFTLPVGHELACEYHKVRGISKIACRNLYKLKNNGIEINEIIFKFLNLLTNLLYLFSLEINRIMEVEEVEFISKSY